MPFVKLPKESITLLKKLLEKGNDLLDAAELPDEVDRVASKLDGFNISGAGVLFSNSAKTMSLGLARRRRPRIIAQDTGIVIKISSIVSGQVGRYNAKTIVPASNDAATGALTESDVGTLVSADDCIVWHVPEIALGSAKHMLKSGVVYEGIRAGVTSAGKTIVRIGVLPIGETASPTTIGANSEGSEAAESTTWSRATNGTPVDVWVHTRQAYYHAGDEKWYAYARKFSYDACGLLIAVTGETRFEVDAPEDCT